MRGVPGSRRGEIGRRRLLALVVALGLSAVACQTTDGAETSTAGVADVATETDSESSTDEAGAGGDATEPPSEADLEEAQLAFEQCMSDAGFEMDFGGGGDGEVVAAEVAPTGGDDPIDGDGFQEALEGCNEAFDGIAGSFDPSPEQEAEIRDAEAAFSNCMSDAGFEFEGDGGAMVFESENQDFEAMDAAMQECSAEAFGEDGILLEEGN